MINNNCRDAEYPKFNVYVCVNYPGKSRTYAINPCRANWQEPSYTEGLATGGYSLWRGPFNSREDAEDFIKDQKKLNK